MRFPRTCGILLHPTSLPSPHGVGDLGPEARQFVDWLEAAGQSLWQVLPLGPTGYGDSPYQCFSAFAGNTMLVSLEDLVEEGWLDATEISGGSFATGPCGFAAAMQFKGPLLRMASARFQRDAAAADRAQFDHFCTHSADWLDDYALFRAIKGQHSESAWTDWDPALVQRDPAVLAEWGRQCEREVNAEKFAQWQFFLQWGRLRERCRAAGIHLMGDVPIFVAHDSADVWAHPDLFRLTAAGRPEFIAGVPPDYFSATGQCWGNPLYRWDVLERRGYGWWVARFRQAFAMVDWVRVDHFRGFEAFWEIPGTDTTAVNGRWVKAPGKKLFEAVRRALGDLPIVAENLGLITPEVETLREELGFPGMAIMQFAFGGDPQAPGFRPHNYTRDLVAYTGTHDNDTTVGWWTSTGASDSTRTPEVVAAEKEVARRYLDIDGREVHWAMIRTLLGSVADVAVIPLQDVLGLGSEARMNLPARAAGNWGWRYERGDLTDSLARRLHGLTQVFGRSRAA
ncbi:MAG: 4-alpha-glucanotransferase [Gemmatimonadaceae bacterium]